MQTRLSVRIGDPIFAPDPALEARVDAPREIEQALAADGDQPGALTEVQQAHRDLEGRRTTGSTVILP